MVAGFLGWASWVDPITTWLFVWNYYIEASNLLKKQRFKLVWISFCVLGTLALFTAYICVAVYDSHWAYFKKNFKFNEMAAAYDKFTKAYKACVYLSMMLNCGSLLVMVAIVF